MLVEQDDILDHEFGRSFEALISPGTHQVLPRWPIQEVAPANGRGRDQRDPQPDIKMDIGTPSEP